MRAHHRHEDAPRRGDVLLPAPRASGHLCAGTPVPHREHLECAPSAEHRGADDHFMDAPSADGKLGSG